MGELDEFEGPADLPPPQELLEYVGQLLVQFGYAETATHFLIWRLLGITLADGRALTARMPLTPRLALLENLCNRHIHSAGRQEQTLAATKALRFAIEYRTMAAHGDWRRRKSGQVVCFSVQYEAPTGDFGIKPVDLSELLSAATDCYKAACNLWDVDAWLKVTPRGSW